MYSVWTAHLKDQEEIERFTKTLLSSKTVLERVKDILVSKEKDLLSSERTLDAYDKPNWDYRQAHKNGYLSCLKNLQNLVDLDQQEHKINDPRLTGQQSGRPS